ncbi:MAG: hypothetical protein A3J84_09235 [Ignavibacteria bacterium RIFOXYA2_FULL_37_17]|nr:MAG: hypothetical protein A3J84_09235 [Ignavibacteria bacterium RIFOXYA2_FULL_37_17]
MNNNEKTICKDFESEVYFYIDNELPADRSVFWKDHLSNCATCRSLLEEINVIVAAAGENISEDILDSKYDKMIENAVRQKKFSLSQLLFPAGSFREKYSVSLKIAVVGMLAIIAFVVSLTTQRPNTVKTISRELLDWEGKKVNSQINEIKNTINLIHEDNWDKQMIMLNQRIKLLEKESDKFSFN